MCKLCHKVYNGQNLPDESQNFISLFLISFFGHLGHIFTNLLLSTLNSRISRIMCIWRHKLCNAKTGVGPTFTWSNEA